MADPATIFISSLNAPWFTFAAVFIDKYGYWLMGALFLLALWRLKKQRKLLVLTLVIAVILTWGIKAAVPVQRPCLEGVSAKIDCPNEASFPSGHSSVAFGLASGSIGSAAGWGLWPFAAFVAFTRLYLGVHSLVDVLGSFALGFVSHGIAFLALRRLEKARKPE